jgi:hypothetical protein
LTSTPTPSPDAAAPPARRPFSFWRTAVAAALAACALALLPAATPSPLALGAGSPFALEGESGAPFDTVRFGGPGGTALLLLGMALLVAGPPRRFAPATDALARRALRLLQGALLLCAAAALLFAPQVEAAFLSLPWIPFALGVLYLGWRLHQQDEHLPLVALLAAGTLRAGSTLLDGGGILPTELMWWLGVLLWGGLVVLGRRVAERDAPEATPGLLAVVAWFVLAVLAVTVQDHLHPLPQHWGADRAAAGDLVRAHPLWGAGLGGFDRAMAEFLHRPPVEGRVSAPGAWRLAAEWGLPAAALLLAALVAASAALTRVAHWTTGRAVAAGWMGLWVAVTLATRAEAFVPLVLALAAAPAAVCSREQPPADADPDDLPPFAFASWGAVALAALAIAAVVLHAPGHYRRQAPQENIAAASYLGRWAEPMRTRAWLIRHRSADLAAYTDPRRELEPVIARWLELAPHDEFAHVEAVRLARADGGPAGALRALELAQRRLPWSDTMVLWRVRALRELQREGEALALLEELQLGRPRLGGVVGRRLIELRQEVRGPQRPRERR